MCRQCLIHRTNATQLELSPNCSFSYGIIILRKKYFQMKNENATLDVLDSILNSISGDSNSNHEYQDIARGLPGFKVKIGKPSALLQQIERNITNSTNCSPESKSTEDEDKGIAEILMLQQRTVLQVIKYSSNK